MILGLLAGGLAKWITPGEQKSGCLFTIVLGIGGAIVGGFIGKFFNAPKTRAIGRRKNKKLRPAFFEILARKKKAKNKEIKNRANGHIHKAGSTRFKNTSASHATVTSMVRPRKYFSFSIHAPGRGRKLMSPGKMPVTKNGKARPSPTKVKTSMIMPVLPVKAKASAVPKNGAEQGVERIVERTPEKKSPTKPS